jgi:hypothetical protein
MTVSNDTTLDAEARIARLERAIVEIAGHPALYTLGWAHPATSEIVAELKEHNGNGGNHAH